jgi:hypothetical protein
MAKATPLPVDPLWHLEVTSFYVEDQNVAELWEHIVAYFHEQGGFRVSKERPGKCSVTLERCEDEWQSGFVVKVRVYAVDTENDLLAIEWQKRRGSAIANHAAWCKFLLRFAQPVC